MPAQPGIVTAMAARLVRTPPAIRLVHAQIEDGACAEPVAALRQCITQGLCGAMPRLFGRNTIVPVLGTSSVAGRQAVRRPRSCGTRRVSPRSRS
jgi:hypothetical protein